MSNRFRSRGRKPWGFTLVELLVVIAIIGILVAMLLPAVQAAREAARRSQCGNNIRQVLLALHNYEDSHNRFPPGGLYGYGPDPRGPFEIPYHHTFNVMILPYLEQQPLYDSTDINLPVWGQPIVATTLPTLRCPSDAGFWDSSETHDIAVTNYPGSEGFHWWPTARVGPWDPWDGFGFQAQGDMSGVFAIHRSCRIAQITDGTSNTIMVAESDSVGFYGGPFLTSGTGARRPHDWGVFRSAFVGTGHGGWAGNENGPNTVYPDGSQQDPWTFFRDGNHVPGAPASNPPTYIAAWGPNAEHHSTSSYHPGGIQAGFADGSVAFIHETIDFGTWLKINSIASNNPAREFR